jgi:predicted DCC family thiol-disulfide oxidoreductase YuxK
VKDEDKGFFYPHWQFSMFRIALGIYLGKHFFDLIPFAGEIWSHQGVLKDSKDLPTYGFFPNLLFWNDSESFVTIFIILMALGSIALSLGLWRRWMALILWYGWACLLGRNPFISNPSMPFIGLMLLLCAVIPQGEPLCLGPKKNGISWHMPRGVFAGIWIIMGVSYSLSGLHKCLSPSWIDGLALKYILENPLARDYALRDFLLELDPLFLKWVTWGTLALEISFAPLSLSKKIRIIPWAGVLIMHLCIMALVRFEDLTWGMILLHFFTLDPKWLAPEKLESNKPIIFFDGVCGLCNHFVHLLFRIDEYKVFLVAPLQGKSAQARLPKDLTEGLNSVIVLTERGKILTKSQGVLWILKSVGGVWVLLAFMIKIIPTPIADYCYDKIATRRYQWFGKKDSCRLPTPEEKGRFLSP